MASRDSSMQHLVHDSTEISAASAHAETARKLDIWRRTSETAQENKEKDVDSIKAFLNSQSTTAEDILNRFHSNIPENVLKEYENHKNSYWKKLMDLQGERATTGADLEKFLDARNQHIEKLVKESSIYLNISSNGLKTALERGKLPGTDDYGDFDNELQNMIFGLPPDLPSEQRYLEGYLKPHEVIRHRPETFKLDPDSPGIIIRFKEHIAKRTTIVFGSWYDCVDEKNALISRPVPYHRPNADAFPLNFDNLKSPDKPISDPCLLQNIEDFPCTAQIFGDVSLDDIDKIIFTGPRYMDNELKNGLEMRGIRYHMPEPQEYELDITWVNKHLAVGGSIHSEEVEALKLQGIDHVLNMQSESRDDEDALQRENIDHLHLPAADGEPPSLEDLEKGTEWVNDRIKRGEGVLIHCKEGVERSVTLAGAVLVTQGYTTNEAIQLIKEQNRSARGISQGPKPGQIKRLREFEARYRAQQ